MAVNVCPRCRRTNPAPAVYCYYDGEALRAGGDGAAHRLPLEFAFPSGRRCRTYDELAQACQEEWADARDLLQRGTFAQFFAATGRADLSRAADEARGQANADIGLAGFVSALPGTRRQSPRLDLQPRRLALGSVPAGEARQMALSVSNPGQGILQGTVSITEGQDWLSLDPARPVHQGAVSTPRQQTISLHVTTRGLAAGQTYGAKLTVVTNGGVVEVPVRLDVAAVPFGKAPFQGVRSQRELAERMRAQPKPGVPLLESGEVRRWFAGNGWTYPVSGPEVRGVAAVQQFFEALGLSKPPALKLAPAELHLRCRYPAGTTGQLTLQTAAKKWVYAAVSSDRPWLRLPQPYVSGPQHASIPLEVDPSRWDGGAQDEASLLVVGNGGQKLSARIVVELQGVPAARRPRAPAAPGGLWPALLTGALLFLLMRLALMPLVDWTGRGGAVQAAAARLGHAEVQGAPVARPGGWLALPWPGVLAGDASVPAELFQPGSSATLAGPDFRDFFARALLRHVVLLTWWLGAPLGAWLVRRAGGTGLDLLWGLLAGAVAGLVGSATFACLLLALDLVPHTFWWVIGAPAGPSAMAGWCLLAVVSWALLGAGLFFALWLVAPWRRGLVGPAQRGAAQLFRVCGLHRLAAAWAPPTSSAVLG